MVRRKPKSKFSFFSLVFASNRMELYKLSYVRIRIVCECSLSALNQPKEAEESNSARKRSFPLRGDCPFLGKGN